MKLLRFSAIWCMYCLYMRSKWEEIEKEIGGLEIEEYDADDHPDTHKKYDIKDIPTFIILDESGNEKLRVEGAKDKEAIIKIIKENL